MMTLLAFALVISLLVFVHEAGHYLSARFFGIRVEAFSIGFGREIAGWTDRAGTRWKLSLLPLGGYVKFLGDMDATSLTSARLDDFTPEERRGLFVFRPMWQRAIVVFAGPFINFLFAFACYIFIFTTVGVATTPPVISQVAPQSAAERAGLEAGDRFVRLDGQPVTQFRDIARLVSINSGLPMQAEVERDGQILDVRFTPDVLEEVDRFGARYKRGVLGVVSGPGTLESVSFPHALVRAGTEVVQVTESMVEGLWQIISGRRSVKELGGPVRIAQFSGHYAQMGWIPLLQFIALISINLGFVNLLPLPMLDGGHLFLYAVEATTGRSISMRIKEVIFTSGFVFLASLMIFLIWNDLSGLWETRQMR